MRPPYTHSSHPSSCSALSDVSVCWAPRSVTSASGAGDFKRSTCLSISSAPWANQAAVAEKEREKRRGKARCRGEGQSGSLSHLVLRSVLDTACGTSLEDTSCPPVKPRIQPLQLPCSSPGPSCTLHSHIDFLEGQEKCGWVVRANEGGRGRRGEVVVRMEKSRELSKALTSPWLHLETLQPC